jgi:hypothetical protein
MSIFAKIRQVYDRLCERRGRDLSPKRVDRHDGQEQGDNQLSGGEPGRLDVLFQGREASVDRMRQERENFSEQADEAYARERQIAVERDSKLLGMPGGW